MIKKLGRYDILSVLGRGSMGVVYKGVDPQIGKLVAIKTMNPKTMRQKDMQERFYREGSLLGQLQHKNLITVYNVGTDGDICYIAMEFLDGISLDRILERKEPIPLPRILRIVKQVCEGVHAAHKKNITHRDLKPANIFIMEDGLVKVLDFGVARLQDSDLTNSGMLLGTINYIAPEQITGLTIDHRADIFSLGVILYEMLSGANPFLSRNVSKTMVKIVNESPPTLKDIPDDLALIVQTALQKNREHRYRDFQEMARQLDKVLRKVDKPNPAGHDPHKELMNKMVNERIDAIKDHIRRESFDQAATGLEQLTRLKPDHPSVDDLRIRLDRARRKTRDKKTYEDKFNQETLKKANQYMVERHYVRAVESCDKVLILDPENKDARVIRATCLRKMERFLEQAKAE
ncbi:MAG: protein kinase [Acidobacteriota bacterium]|nr:protein kinase [Acidobacteriota bacterium]